MNDRTTQILEAAIQEFIDTGEPVSSGWLYKQYDFGIKPAMIRLELDALEDGGYLEQPYHSAGRVPTDVGYEFYAKRALAAAASRVTAAHMVRASALRNMLQRGAWNDLANALSEELGLLSVAVDPVADTIYKTGLEALIENLNWQDRDELRSVIHDFESVGERLPGAADKMGDAAANGPQVFIGKKSPVTESENLSVVYNTYQVGDATVSIFAIGPKRMDYKKVIKIFTNL
jgi:transcriptional regulator of heat shock response